MQRNWYQIGLLIVAIVIFFWDLFYGILLGSSSSLIRSVGHLALIILLIIKHSEIKFSITLWAWVMLIILPAVYPGISGMFLLSGYTEGIDQNKLFKDLVWILIGIIILVLNRRYKFSTKPESHGDQ